MDADTRDIIETGLSAVSTGEIIPFVSKYAAKKLALKDEVINRDKVKNNRAVETEERKLHKKVSRNLLVSLRNEMATVACPVTGIVSVLHIPTIPGKALIWESPLSSLGNARGIAQEGYDYLNKLDTQILAGIFIVLASEYELIRTIPSATGAENNAILRTASKEKIIQGILLIECFIHSSNRTYLPILSLIYDSVLKESGVESRLTEWMRLVEEAIEKPDLSLYDENALLNKPMKSIAELKKEHSASWKEEKRKNSLKDPLFKERAQFRKDMKEAKVLVKAISSEGSKKLISFLNQLFTEESYLTVDKALLGQVVTKLEGIEGSSAVRLIQILNTDRDNLRKEISIDDLDDPLMVIVAEGQRPGSEKETLEVEPLAEGEHNPEPEAIAGEFDMVPASIVNVSSGMVPAADFSTEPTMPEGLSFVEKVLWKKRNAK